MLKRTIYEACYRCGQKAAELLPDGSVRVAHRCPKAPPGPPAPPVTYRAGEVEYVPATPTPAAQEGE